MGRGLAVVTVALGCVSVLGGCANDSSSHSTSDDTVTFSGRIVGPAGRPPHECGLTVGSTDPGAKVEAVGQIVGATGKWSWTLAKNTDYVFEASCDVKTGTTTVTWHGSSQSVNSATQHGPVLITVK